MKEFATPWLIANPMPMPQSMTRTATFSTALASLTHLLSDIGRMPMSTMSQINAMTMISAEVRLMPPQNAADSVPANMTKTAGAQ